jgi:mannose-6-phosphate isomerase
MEMPDGKQQDVISEILINIEKSGGLDSPESPGKWIKKLADEYPSDIGIASPLFLNLFCLAPGEALFLPAGELHAYLEGLGIELMANSDNVLRGGLTPKHVDVPELLNVLNFRESHPEILIPGPVSETEARYPVPVEEFQLSVITTDPGKTHSSPPFHSADILLCTDGSVQILNGGSDDPLPDVKIKTDIKKGQSVLIPASVGAYQITGAGVCYKAGIPV